jgi:hypothetical protein
MLNPSGESGSGTPTIRTNLAPNPNAATSTGYFGANGVAISGAANQSGGPFNNNTYFRITATGTATGMNYFAVAYGQPGAGNAAVVTAGTVYTLSAYIRVTMSSFTVQPSVRLRWKDAAGTTLGDLNTPAVGASNGKWIRISVTGTAPANAAYIEAMGGYQSIDQSTISIGDTVDMSAILVEATNTVLPYFDGTIPASENLAKSAATANTGTTTHTINVSYAGSTWTRTSVAANGVSLTRQYVDPNSLRVGETYTTAVTLANDQATAQQVTIDWADIGSVTYTLAPGEQKRLVTSGLRTYDATYRFADLHVNPSSTESRSILFKDWIIEPTATTGEYYTGTGDYTYAWSGTANASTSVQRSISADYWYGTTTASTFQSSTHKYSAGKSIGVLMKGVPGDGASAADTSGIVAGGSYTFSAWVKTTTNFTTLALIRWKLADQSIISDSIATVTPTLGQWTRVSVTAVAPANAALAQPMIRTLTAHSSALFYIDDVLFERASLLDSYFDGTTPAAAAGDFTYSWAGVAHKSYAYQQAPALAGWSNRWFGNGGGHGALYQAKGGISGTYARKLWTTANTGATMDVGLNPTVDIPVSGNLTYTLSAWVRCSVAQNFNFYINWHDSSNVKVGNTQVAIGTSVTANKWTRLSVTATSPLTATYAVIVPGTYGQALTMPAGSTMDFDNVLFEASPTLNDYFDGSNPIQNMCTNPSFDVDTSGWTATSLSTHRRDTSQAYTGAASVFGVATDNLGDSMYTNTVPYDVTAGSVYTLSAYAWIPSGVVASEFREGTRNFWAVAAANSIPSLVTQANLDFSKTNQWQRVSTTITIPEGSNRLNVRMYFPANVKGIYWDSVLVEKSSTLNPYYEGTGDFSYLWTGTANASTSIQRATKVASYGMANQAVIYTVGPSGARRGRIHFTNNTIGDSGMNFSGAMSMASSKTYTISVTLTSDINRTVKWSAQGTGTVNQGPPAVSLIAGVPTRLSWTFATTATAPTAAAVYLLRADMLLGTIDFDHVMIEEGAYVNGPYFDGSRVEQNLIGNSNFEVDATNWWPNTGSPTLSASTDRAYLGTKSLKAVSTLATTDVAVTISVTLKPSTTYTLSYYVYSPDARSACYFDIGSVNFGAMRQGERAIPAGVWTRVFATFTTSANIAGQSAFYLHHAGGPAAISTVYIDCVLLEESNTLNNYYEGSGDFTYAWTGGAHATPSVQRGISVARTSSERAFAISTTRNGEKAVRVIPASKGPSPYSAYTGDDVFINLYSQPPSLKPNTTYTLHAVVSVEEPTSNNAKFRFNIDGLDVSSPLIPKGVGDHTVNWQFSTGANGTMSFLRLMPGASGVPGYTNEVILKKFLLIEGPYTGGYFDGSSAASTDFSFSWTGTADNSTSIKKAVGVLNLTSGNSWVLQSSEWSASGGKSIRITPTNQYNSTSVIINFLNLEKGKTYTMLATRRLAAPLTGTLSSYAGTISSVQTGVNTFYSPQLPNVAGVGTTRLKFRYDENAGASTFRLGHGGSEGSGDVWWDNVMVVEGDYDGDYIDGSKPLSKWEGTPNASTSIGYPPQFLDIAGTPVKSHTSYIALANTNPSPDTGPRTLYLVYETYGFTSAYQNPGYYGVYGTGRATFQTQNANQNILAVRFDFPNGEINRVMVFNGVGRNNSTRYVAAVTVEPAEARAAGCLNGGTDTVITNLVGGDGWTGNDQMNLGTQSETKGLHLLVFHAAHDRATRLAMSSYLGNKYGANVA